MSDFTDWAENELCRIITGGSASFPAALSIALCSSAGDAGFEDVQGLPRVSAPRTLDTWSGTQGAGSVTVSSGTSRAISNNITFDFGQAAVDATANVIGIYSGDNPLCYIPMNVPMVINAGDAVQIAAGDIILTLSSVGGLTHYAANKLLDLIFRGQPFSFPAEYQVALFTTAPSLSGGGVEVSGSGYSRASLSAWTTPEDGSVATAAVVQYDAPQAAWGVVRAAGLISNGTLIFTTALSEPKAPLASQSGRLL